MFHGRPVHSLMLSSHRFRCLPLRLPPWTVPCRIVLASPDDRVMCPYHFSLRLFTVVKRSSYGPMAFPILAFTFSLVMWSLWEIPRSLRSKNNRLLQKSYLFSEGIPVSGSCSSVQKWAWWWHWKTGDPLPPPWSAATATASLSPHRYSDHSLASVSQ